jgi:hypothetical protein
MGESARMDGTTKLVPQWKVELNTLGRPGVVARAKSQKQNGRCVTF